MHRINTDAPWDIDVVTIDTTYVDLSFEATGSADRGRTVSQFATLYGVQVAWNGDLFHPLVFEPEGLAFGGRGANVALWPNSMDTDAEAFISFASGVQSEVRISRNLPAGTSMAGWVGAIGGRPVIVEGGQTATQFDCTDVEVDPCNPQPRTAIGTSPPISVLPPRFVIVAVVAGRSATSRGMRMEELAALMREMGAGDAIALDGGGSSTLYIANQMGIQNQLADGVERLVANHVGVRYDPSPTLYTLEGRVQDPGGATIVGATVTRDDGKVTTTYTAPPGNDDYDFNAFPIPARYVCISVHKTGYRSNGACKQINPAGGSISYLNLTLMPGVDPPDAGTPDAAPPDAAPRPDAGVDAPVQRDGGDNSIVGDPGCSCQVGGTGAHGGALLALAALAAFARRRRR
jgi:MYXO-CTERM domain-containing protein